MVGLSIYLILYSVLHSVLADDVLMKRYYYKWWYRFFYVLISSVLLIPAWIIYVKLPKIYFFNPPVYVKAFLYLIDLLALAFGYYASKSYDNSSFLGIKQVKNFIKYGIRDVKPEEKFVKNGALKFVRHPYYFTAIILLWFRPMYYKDLVVSVIFTIYLVVGAINEERKLIRKFGEEYIKYKKDVSMLIPFIKRSKY
ncbi:isoprenylcysteine carboxylmethyltransferase family protein [Deferribacter thermophilus]|uniref:methyltransferase family protein n=1 Tax=Deferribacter thermophilus TaxID=53573 RepID=UPI003C1ADB6F